MGDYEKEDIRIGGKASDMAFLASLMQNQGIPAKMLPGSGYRGSGRLFVPGSHAHLARKILREYADKDFEIITPEQYAKNQRRLLIFLILSSLLAVGITALIIHLRQQY